MIDVTVTVGEKEFKYQFKHFWQVKWFVLALNWFVKLLGKLYGVPMNVDQENS